MARVAFINPPWWAAGEDGKLRQGIRAGSRWPFTRHAAYAPDMFRFGYYLPFPFFLSSAAAWAKKELQGSEVLIRDSIARGESYKSFFAWILSAKPTHVILETGAAAIDHDLELIGKLRGYLPGVKVALAGPPAGTLFKEDRKVRAEAYIQGEYEKNAVKFVGGAEGLIGFDLLTQKEMAEKLPWPKFDESAALNYWDACPVGQEPPQLQLLTSRGCPFKCCFCAWPATMTGEDPDGTKPRAVRYHPADWVEMFIRYRLNRAEAAGAPIKTIYVDDDTFNLVPKHVEEISEVLAKIGLPWFAMCRADTIKRDHWQLMKDSGCKGVKLGFESGVQRVVDEIVNKHLNLEEASETARWLRSIGMTVHGTFTVGLPGETQEERKATVDFIRNLYDTGGLDTHQLSGTAEIAGTPLHTLRTGGKDLPKFPGAHIDSDYSPSPDGQAKIEVMR